jgi:hypothetical protein
MPLRFARRWLVAGGIGLAIGSVAVAVAVLVARTNRAAAFIHEIERGQDLLRAADSAWTHPLDVSDAIQART